MQKFALVALAVLGSAVAQVSASTTYLASTSFTSAYANNGVSTGEFSFGSGTLGGAPATFALHGDIGSGVLGLYNVASDFTPGVFYNPTATTNTVAGTVVLDPGQMAMHPGVGNEYSIVEFTAPSAGTYSLNALFTNQAAHPPATTDLHLYVNGFSTTNKTLGLTPANTTADLSGTFSLLAGQKLDIYVGYGTGGYGSDTSALLNGGISVTAIPLPASVYGGGVLIGALATVRFLKRR